MRRYLLAAAAFGVALVLAPQSRAQDEAKAIIEKAIKAHGGADKMAKTKAIRPTAKGNLQLMGQALGYTETSTIQPPNQVQSALTPEIMGQQIPIIVVDDSKTCWVKGPQGVMEDPPWPQTRSRAPCMPLASAC